MIILYIIIQLYSRNQPMAEKIESLTAPELHNTVSTLISTSLNPLYSACTELPIIRYQ